MYKINIYLSFLQPGLAAAEPIANFASSEVAEKIRVIINSKEQSINVTFGIELRACFEETVSPAGTTFFTTINSVTSNSVQATMMKKQ